MLELETFNKILNSDLNFLKRLLIITKFLLGSNQNTGIKMIPRRIVLIQFKEKLKKDEGSNTEKRFLIIINFFCFLKEFWKCLRP